MSSGSARPCPAASSRGAVPRKTSPNGRRSSSATSTPAFPDRKSTRLNSSHSLHDALPIYEFWFGATLPGGIFSGRSSPEDIAKWKEIFISHFNAGVPRSEEHTSELQSLPPRRSSDL